MEKRFLSPGEISDFVLEVGVAKTKNSNANVLILSIFAGFFIAFGGFASSMVSQNFTNLGIQKLISGAIFPVGLILVLICGAELFTGNSLLVMGAISGKIQWKSVFKNWIIVYIGNYIGAAIMALLAYGAGLLSVGNMGVYAITVASNKANLSVSQAFCSGILCNIVVCLAVWGSYGARDVSGKILMSFFPIMGFVVSGFEHSVANMYYFTMGLLAKHSGLFIPNAALNMNIVDKLNFNGVLKNLTTVTLGDIVGGGIIISVGYYFVFARGKKQG